MAATETNLARFEADIIDFTKKMKEMAGSSDRAAERVRRGHDKASDDVSKAWKKSGFDDAMKRNIGSANSLRDALTKIAPALAAAFSVKAAVTAADTYTKFTNSLKVAGLEGDNLKTVQEALYQSAAKNGTAIEPLSALYSRASQSAKELGASQGDLLKFTNGVTAALRVQGGSTESASGALTQLSQALSGGVIHAEEFNSINDGARPILEAVAAGNAKYGGSVAKLRAEMLTGKLASADFFRDFLNGSAMLEAKAAKAPLTVQASYQVLENALVRGIGQLNESTGATAKLTDGLTWLANNLDHVAEAIGVVAAILGGAFVANGAKAVSSMVLQVAAQEAMTVSAASATVATRALSAALAVVGGPWGLAIMAIAGALGFLAVKGFEAEAASNALNKSINDQYDALKDVKAASTEQAAKTGELSKEQLSAITKTAALTGETNLLADAHWRVVAAIKAERLEQLNLKADKARDQAREARGARERSETTMAAPMPTTMGVVSMPMNKPVNAAARELERKAREISQAADKDVLDFKATSLKDVKLDKPAPAVVTPGKGKKGRSAADIDRSDDKALAQAVQEELQYRLSNVKTEADRHALAVELLDTEHQNRLTAIDDDKNTSATAKTALKASEERLYKSRQLVEIDTNIANTAEEEKDARDKRLDALRQDNEAAQRLAELNEDLLTWQARNAKTAGERARFEAAALASKQKRELDQIDAEIALALATKDAAAAMRLQAQRAVIVQRQGYETADQQEQGKSDTGDWGQWAKSKTTDVFDPAEINKSLQDIADNGLAGLTDGITNAIMGAGSLKDAFKDVAKSIIADLIKIAVKMLIFKALGTLFPGFGQVASAAVSVGRNAAGTDKWKGGPTTLNENGDEAYLLPQGSQVAPAGLLRSALSQMAHGGGGRSGGTIINNHTTVNANDAVMTGWVRQEIMAAQIQGSQYTKGASVKEVQRINRNRL